MRQLPESTDVSHPGIRRLGTGGTRISTLRLNSRPVKTGIHVRRLLNLAQLYGRTEVLAAISHALALATYDAACVENLLLAEHRRLASATPHAGHSPRPNAAN